MTALVLLILGGLLAAAAWWASMRSVASSHQVVVVAALGGLAAGGQMLVPIPGLEPGTAIVVCVSAALGVRLAAAVGAVSVLGVAAAGGVGPWTLWQVVGYVAVALLAAGAFRLVLLPATRSTVTFVAMLSALAFDVLLTVTGYLPYATDTSAAAWLALALAGLPILILHLAATGAMAWIAGPALLRCLQRAAARMAPADATASRTASRSVMASR